MKRYLVGTILSAALAIAAHAAPRYQTEAFAIGSTATDINDAGNVLMTFSGVTAGIWSGGTLYMLPSFGASQIGVSEIGADSTVVGTLFQRPYAWTGLVPRDLNRDTGYRGSAFGILSTGAIVGGSVSDTFGGSSQRATIWSAGTTTYLPEGFDMLMGADATGGYIGFRSIHGRGQAYASWDFTTWTNLDGPASISPAETQARAINASGTVVGSTAYAGTPMNFKAAFWDKNDPVAKLLPTFSSSNSAFSFAWDVNDSGDIVGYSEGLNFRHAVLWKDGQLVDLNDYLDPALKAAGWYMYEATGINARGDIVGNLDNLALNEQRAVVLQAVPEPDAWFLMVGGLTFVALRTRWSTKGRRA